MVTFCLKCGAQAVDDTSSFCNICGTQFTANIPEKKSDICQNRGAIIQMPAGKNGGLWIEEVREVQPIKPTKTTEIKKRRINIGIIIVWGILFSLILLGIIFPPQDNFLDIIIAPQNDSLRSSPILQHTPTPLANLTPIPNLTLTQTPIPSPTLTSNESSIAPEILKLPIGEGSGDGIKSVMVFSVNITNNYSYYSEILNKTQVVTAPPGKIFVIVDAGIKNTGMQSLNASSTSFSITDSNGYKYDPYFLYYGDDGLKMQQLYLNQISIGKILFVIPASSKELRLQYDFGDFVSGPKLVTWSIN